MSATIKQREALIALRNEGPLVNSYRFSACTLNSLVDHGWARITKGRRGGRKCTYTLTQRGYSVADTTVIRTSFPLASKA